jgi:tetratricopeptide (TPR) repeat protein
MRWALALILLTATFAAAPAAAQRNPLIQRGQEEYDELRYDEALQTLSAALVRSGNTDNDLARIYRLLAFTYLALRREEEAAGAYRHMLPLAPDFVPGDDVSPRVREFFNRVAQEWEQAGRPGTGPPPPIEIRHRSPARAERNTEVALTTELDDPAGRAASVVVAYRQGSDAVFTRREAESTDAGWVATIPASDVRPPLIEYYIEVLDAQGLPLAARGDVAAPLRIAVPAPGGGEVWQEWWFWTIIGVVVAGGIVAAVVIADQLGQQGPNTGTLTITVE